MPSDAFAALQALHASLGREPSLEELYRYLSSPPSGRVLPGPIGEGAHALGSSDDARAQAHLTEYELGEMVPDLRRVRESMLREILFGCYAPQGPGLRMGERPQQRQPSPGHPFPFPKPS